jgi:hypothetical protein
MAYYKVRIEAWCARDPAESSLRDIGQQVIRGDGAVCTLQEVVTVVDRPQDTAVDLEGTEREFVEAHTCLLERCMLRALFGGDGREG